MKGLIQLKSADQVIAGTAGVPPVMSAKREHELEAICQRLRAFGAFAGETPAVSAIT